MSEFAFQQALVRLLTDAEARRTFFAGDTALFTELGVPVEEAQRVLSIDPARLEVFADMLLGQRLNDAAQLLPYTAQLLGTRMHQIAFEFNQEIKPSYSTKFDHGLAFARFLQEQFREQPPSPAYVEDVLAYETASLDLYSKRSRLDPPDGGLTARLHEPEVQSKVAPYRQPNHRVLRLNYNVAEIVKELKERRVPDAEPWQMNVLLHVTPEGLVEQDEINHPTLAFIDACDGQTSLAEIIEQLAAAFRQTAPPVFPDFRRKCAGLCAAVVERGVVGLRPLTADA
jgi:hypothetical protein